MAISFNKQKGSAQKTSISTFQYKDGDNRMRICGDILARSSVAGATLLSALTTEKSKLSTSRRSSGNLLSVPLKTSAILLIQLLAGILSSSASRPALCLIT